MKKATQIALTKIGIKAEAYAANEAPVDTGRLRSSITYLVDDDTMFLGTNVEYAIYQEFGTRYQKGKPFLRPAIMNHVQEYTKIVEEELKR